MSRLWARSLDSNSNNSGYFGSAEMFQVGVGATLMRTLWSINLWGTWGSVDQYPPGSSICRAGIILAESGLPPGSTPTPISQAAENWMDLVTLIPVGQIATSTGVDWQYNWQTLTDRQAKAQRSNDSGVQQSLYVAWEFIVGTDAIAGFGMTGWSSAADGYLNIPD